jgi:5-hydroxyisourate hydrolase-like protein (transthyretin family)
MLQGIVADLNSKEILPGAKIDLTDLNGNVLSSTFADAKGYYSFEIEPGLDYKLIGNKDNYFVNQQTFTTKNLDGDFEVIEKKLDLEKDPGISLFAIITDRKTGKPIEGVKITLVDNQSGKKINHITTETGDFRKPLADKKLGDKGEYSLALEKDGYFSKVVKYNTTWINGFSIRCVKN